MPGTISPSSSTQTLGKATQKQSDRGALVQSSIVGTKKTQGHLTTTNIITRTAEHAAQTDRQAKQNHVTNEYRSPVGNKYTKGKWFGNIRERLKLSREAGGYVLH